MQQPIDLLYSLLLGVGFVIQERPELFPEDHPISVLMKSLEGTPLADSIAKRIEGQSDEDTVMMLYNVLNATVKQLQTYH